MIMRNHHLCRFAKKQSLGVELCFFCCREVTPEPLAQKLTEVCFFVEAGSKPSAPYALTSAVTLWSVCLENNAKNFALSEFAGLFYQRSYIDAYGAKCPLVMW